MDSQISYVPAILDFAAGLSDHLFVHVRVMIKFWKASGCRIPNVHKYISLALLFDRNLFLGITWSLRIVSTRQRNKQRDMKNHVSLD